MMTAKKGHTYPSLKVTPKRFVERFVLFICIFYVQQYLNGAKFPAAKDLHKCGTSRGINYINVYFHLFFLPNRRELLIFHQQSTEVKYKS